MSTTRRTYEADVKRNAVALTEKLEKKVPEVAERLGIEPKQEPFRSREHVFGYLGLCVISHAPPLAWRAEKKHPDVIRVLSCLVRG